MSFSAAKVSNFVELESKICHITLLFIPFLRWRKYNQLIISSYANVNVENFLEVESLY